jgi:hypothetical protein
MAGMRVCYTRGAKDIQKLLVKDLGRCGQYVLLKVSYVTRSVRPYHSWFFVFDSEFRLREEPEVGFMSASRRPES